MDQAESEGVDVVWLKKDIRLHDHAPLSTICGSSNRCIIIYLYEPDQLSEKTVHGSHVEFINEGLVDLDLRLSGTVQKQSSNIYEHKYKCITVCKAGAAFTLRTLHKKYKINHIYCHLESGHLKSFSRDKAVRRICRSNNIPITEFNQTGVTRCLSDRDDFTKLFHKWLYQPMPQTPTEQQLSSMRRRLLSLGKIDLHGLLASPLSPRDMQEIPIEHRGDRVERQKGGETLALDYLDSFLSRRAVKYSAGISSPNTSWTTGSRLSPYLTWGHVSIRRVIIDLKRKQEELRQAKKKTKEPSPWLRSLAAFSSRMHWRSHFMQKLESQPSIEIQDQCLAYSHLRRQPGDFVQERFDAWCQGRTGYPFVDACMRSLIHRGWLNFRMRAMLVSFATYNLWLDWKKIAGHLARVFLDYEPGIHYPQLQMQAATTGINAMRVYNVSKQGKDQDPEGVFIRKFIPELRSVPPEYIHEPWLMPPGVQKKYKVIIGDGKQNPNGLQAMFQPIESEGGASASKDIAHYPSPIVDEKASAKEAKDRVTAIRKQVTTKIEAHQVFIKHGSRRNQQQNRDGAKPKALSSSVKRVEVDKGQTSINKWATASSAKKAKKTPTKSESGMVDLTQQSSSAAKPKPSLLSQPTSKSSGRKKFIVSHFETKCSGEENTKQPGGFSCNVCTFYNDKPHALACSMCGSIRE